MDQLLVNSSTVCKNTNFLSNEKNSNCFHEIFFSAGFDTDFVRKVAQNYPGRASSSPTIDVFITLMQMGTSGYKELMDERRENYKLLKDEMCKVAEKYGERVLETKNNPISIGKINFFRFGAFSRKKKL